MSNLAPLERFRENLVRTISKQRYTLLATGIIIALLGFASIIVPLAVAESILWLIGILFIISGLLKLAQWMVGKIRGGHQVHGFFVIFCHSVIDLLIGFFLFYRLSISVTLLAIVVGTALFADGLVQILIGLRLRDFRHRIILYVSGGLTCGVAILAAIFSRDPTMTDGLAILIGVKLLLFGGMLIYLSLTARDTHVAQIYGAPDPLEVEKTPGEAYAVFIGNAFHLGVYVGENHVVDFRDTNMVYKVTWEQFLLGRQPQHWEYPDLPAVPPEDVCRFALDQVGKNLQYHFFTFNCEHFAIWCKSLGQLKASRFAQVNAAFDNVANRPLLGPMVEIYSRAMEMLAFKLGGVFGKRASLWLRGTSALLGRWILSSRVKKQESAKSQSSQTPE